MKKVIILKDEEKEVLAGLRKVNDFYEELSLDFCSNWLYLDKSGDIDIHYCLMITLLFMEGNG